MTDRDDLVELTQVWVDGPFKRRDVNGVWRWVQGYWRNQRTGESLEGKIHKPGRAYTAKERKQLGLPLEPDPPPIDAKPLPKDPPPPPKSERLKKLDAKLKRAKKAGATLEPGGFKVGQRVRTKAGYFGTVEKAERPTIPGITHERDTKVLYHVRANDGRLGLYTKDQLRAVTAVQEKKPDPEPKFQVGQRVLHRGTLYVVAAMTRDLDGDPHYRLERPGLGTSQQPKEMFREEELTANEEAFPIGAKVRTPSKRGGVVIGLGRRFAGFTHRVKWPNGKVEEFPEYQTKLVPDRKFQVGNVVAWRRQHGVIEAVTDDSEGNTWYHVRPDVSQAGGTVAVNEKDLKLFRAPKRGDRVAHAVSGRTGTVISSRNTSITGATRSIRWDDTGEVTQADVVQLRPTERERPRYPVGAAVRLKGSQDAGVVERVDPPYVTDAGIIRPGLRYSVRLDSGELVQKAEPDLYQEGRFEPTDRFQARARVRTPEGLIPKTGNVVGIADRQPDGSPIYEVQWDDGTVTQEAEISGSILATNDVVQFPVRSRVEFNNGGDTGTVIRVEHGADGPVYHVDLDEPEVVTGGVLTATDVDLTEGPKFRGGDRIFVVGSGTGTVLSRFHSFSGKKQDEPPKWGYNVVFDDGMGMVDRIVEGQFVGVRSPQAQPFDVGARVASQGRVGTITEITGTRAGERDTQLPTDFLVKWDGSDAEEIVNRADLRVVTTDPKFRHGDWVRHTTTGQVMRVAEVFPSTRSNKEAAYRGWVVGEPLPKYGRGREADEGDLEPTEDPKWEPPGGWNAFPNELPPVDADPLVASRAYQRRVVERTGKGRFDDERLTVANLGAMESRWQNGGTPEMTRSFPSVPTGERMYWRNEGDGSLVEPGLEDFYEDLRELADRVEEVTGRRSRWTGETKLYPPSMGKAAMAVAQDGTVLSAARWKDRKSRVFEETGLLGEDRARLEQDYRFRVAAMIHELGHTISYHPLNGDPGSYTSKHPAYEEAFVEMWQRLHFDEVTKGTQFELQPDRPMQLYLYLKGGSRWGAYQDAIDHVMDIANMIGVIGDNLTDLERDRDWYDRNVEQLTRFVDTIMHTPLELRRHVIEEMAQRAWEDGTANSTDRQRFNDHMAFLDSWDPEHKRN